MAKESIPVKNGYFDEVWMFHMIEHLTKILRADVLFEINRVLKIGGTAIFTYPEFEKCAKNFIDNKDGNRDFWEATLYGRQSHSFDYHVVPMHTTLFKHELIDYGFKQIKSDIESETESHNTITTAIKSNNICTREDVIAREVCGAR